MAPFPPGVDQADDPYEVFELQHADQLVAAAIPPKYWRAIYDKLTNETFDAGAYFQIVAEESEDGLHNYSVVTLKEIDTEDPNSIFLIDHAWTFRPQIARQHLREIPGLLERVCPVFDIDIKDFLDEEASAKHDETVEETAKRLVASASATRLSVDEHDPLGLVSSPMYGSMYRSREDCISEALERMWKYIQTYTIRYVEKEPQESDMPVWYMPDEFGVRIGHSDEPNFRMIPMFYHPQKAAYSLLFPIKNTKVGETVTRDYVDTSILRRNPSWRSILMHPWVPIDLTKEKLQVVTGTDEFFMEGRKPDTLPEKDVAMTRTVVSKSGPVKVYADDFQFIDRMKTVQVQKVDSMADADVVWMRGHFRDYKALAESNPNAFVNQFPCEAVLTVKDLLAASIQSYYSDGKMDQETMRWPPLWFETTFNLNNALPQFIAYFQQRELRGMDNTWIIKPWNLARGLDMHVTDNLSYIIRLVESGPKIACKYIHRPLLFLRPDNGNLVKFDLRYIIMVNNLKPLELLLYNKFWIRFAINEFSLTELDDRETHFTVFNYDYKSKVLNMKCEDFIERLEKQYPSLRWSNIQSRINKVIKEAVQAVSSGKPPRSIMANPQSRAMYGVDIMLKWDSDDEKTRQLEISFIEANFMPDCERACDYYEDFADTAFKAMFMGEVDFKEFTAL